MFTAMRPQILFPLFAEVSSLKGVGPRILPLVQKVAGPLVRDLVFLSPSGVIVRRPMEAATAVDGEVGIFEIVIDRLFVPSRPGAPLKVRASDATQKKIRSAPAKCLLSSRQGRLPPLVRAPFVRDTKLRKTRKWRSSKN